MLKKILKISSIILVVTLLMFALIPSVLADETIIDWDRLGSITIAPRSVDGEHEIIGGSEFTIYYVAELVSENYNLAFALNSPFSDSGIDVSDINAPGLTKELSDYINQHEITGITESANEEGNVIFSELQLGLYLAVQTGVSNGHYAAEPFLVCVPMSNEQGTGWVYDIEASPKVENSELINITCIKVWNDGDDTSSRPASITVKLYRGEALVDTVVLNEENSWTHTWTDLPISDDYHIEEVGVDGYVVSYQQDGYVFTITNTPKLVQTGQLNWPVPLLAGCGIAVFAIGWALVFLKKKKA